MTEASAVIPEVDKFDFESDFQTKIVALATRDEGFLRRTSGVLKPEFFDNAGEAKIVEFALKHLMNYGCAPDRMSVNLRLKEGVAKKSISESLSKSVTESLNEIYKADISNGTFYEEAVVAFAKNQALIAAVMQCAEYVNKGQHDKIPKVIEEAMAIGVNEEGHSYDYFSLNSIKERTRTRVERASGVKPPLGITTGHTKLDKLLYHNGWGRKELSCIMGGAKAGKSTALLQFGRMASLGGYNVLYVTLEVSTKIVADRLDAATSNTEMKMLDIKSKDVARSVHAIGSVSSTGRLFVNEFASGTCSPNMIRNLIQKYKMPAAQPDGTVREAIKFDLIIVDYADIMAPNYRTTDPIENSKNVFVDLRAIAFEENAAVLTATQTNREGFKSAVAKAEHVAEDFNKVRTVDILLSINRTEEESDRGEARLYFAASRNQESGFTVVIKQNINKMRFIEDIVRVE